MKVDLSPLPQGDSPRAKELARRLAEKMAELEKEVRMAIARKIAEDFMDPLGPVNALSEAALAPEGEPDMSLYRAYMYVQCSNYATLRY